jgi:uncharacterized membrane protein YeaQ/YmgE (transglycosylase-associated protein family)
MGINAWIVLGVAVVLLASMLILGRRSPGLILTGLIGIAGAAVVLLGWPRISGQSGQSWHTGRVAHR